MVAYSEKACVTCGITFVPRGSTQRYCVPCGEDNYREKRRDQNLKPFGITAKQYDALLESQDGKCAICGESRESFASKKRLAVDHDHGSGEVRGLLCTYCNTRLGWWEEHREAVERYLK